MNAKQMKIYYTGCKAIFDHYGVENLKGQLIQELSELITALTKDDKENIIEEIANVQVMLDQFTINDSEMFEKLQVIQREKVIRQLKRILEDKKKNETNENTSNYR